MDKEMAPKTLCGDVVATIATLRSKPDLDQLEEAGVPELGAKLDLSREGVAHPSKAVGPTVDDGFFVFEREGTAIRLIVDAVIPPCSCKSMACCHKATSRFKLDQDAVAAALLPRLEELVVKLREVATTDPG